MTDNVQVTVGGGQIQGVVGARTVTIENLTIYNRPEEAAPKDGATKEIPPCPYPGLSYFGPGDASVFFGRSAAIDRLEPKVSQQPLTALVGASGSGKSSVVLAGLAPRLQSRGNWRFSHFRIGTELKRNPFVALSRALVPLYVSSSSDTVRLKNTKELAADLQAKKLSLTDVFADCRARNKSTGILLIADQFEEAFTAVEDNGVRDHFIETLLEGFLANKGNGGEKIHLILTLRGDFYGRALRYRAFADALQDNTENLGPMNKAELTEAIVSPAKTVGRTFEPGLVETLLDSVANKPGSLPLLQFALREMWPKQEGGKLSRKNYDDILGIEGALAKRAEEIFLSSEAADRTKTIERTFRRLFTRMVTLGEGQADTRRVVEREEVGEEAWSLAMRLADEDNRLVVTSATISGPATAEVAHEALIRNWPRLIGWIDQDRSFQSWLRQIQPNVKLLSKDPNDEAPLLRGSMLAQAKDWLDGRPDDLSGAEQDFIRKSIATEAQRRIKSQQDAERLKAAEAKAILERQAAAKLQLELAALKDLYNRPGAVAPILIKDNDATEVKVASPSAREAVNPPLSGSSSWVTSAVGADNSPFSGAGCVVAVFGTGIDANHPAFRGVTLVQKDFTNTGNGDRNGHSTHTAATIFGRSIEGKRIGIAPGIEKALIVKVLDDSGGGNESSILSGFQWVLDSGGVDVICLPMGFQQSSQIVGQLEAGSDKGVTISSGLRNYLQLVRVYERITILANTSGHGAVIIAAAGNDSQTSARTPVNSPLSVAQGVISVGAVADSDKGYEPAYFSNSYPTFCAPGVEVESAFPGGGLKTMSGTSMSCACAAGVAALWWECLRSKHSSVTSQMVEDQLMKSARTDVFAPNFEDFERGYGLVQAPR